MITPYQHLRGQLAKTPKKWLVTGVASFTCASSSTYGDHLGLPKVEDTIGKPLSGSLKANFVTCYQADNSIGKIRTSPIWSREACFIC